MKSKKKHPSMACPRFAAMVKDLPVRMRESIIVDVETTFQLYEAVKVEYHCAPMPMDAMLEFELQQLRIWLLRYRRFDASGSDPRIS